MKDFIINNYILIMSILLVTIITLIGYFVDKKRSKKEIKQEFYNGINTNNMNNSISNYNFNNMINNTNKASNNIDNMNQSYNISNNIYQQNTTNNNSVDQNRQGNF